MNNLIKAVAQYLQSNGFEDITTEVMPDTPNTFVTVYGTGVRPNRDEEGSRFQVIVRGEPRVDCIEHALTIMDLLDDFSGALSYASNIYVQRIRLENGATSLGLDEAQRIRYSMNFRAWYC